jgi:hypothetical protein
MGVVTLGILGLSLGSPKTKSHLDVAPMKSCRVYYKGEGDDFSQVRAVVSLMSLRLPVTHSSTKSAQFDPRTPAHPFTPTKCYKPKSVPRLLTLLLFLIWTHI